jgi:hypothetical protein
LKVAGGIDAAGIATDDAGAVEAGAIAAKARTALAVVLAALQFFDTGGIEWWSGAGTGISWLAAGTGLHATATAQLSAAGA